MRILRLVLLGTAIWVASKSSAFSLYSISEPQFGSRIVEQGEASFGISDPTPPGGTVSREKLHKYIWVAVVLSGGREALKYLEENDNLPMKVEFWLDDTFQDRIDFGISQRQWIENEEKIRHEVLMKTKFDWRVKFRSQKIWGGKLELKFKNHLMNEIAPFGKNGAYTAIIHFK